MQHRVAARHNLQDFVSDSTTCNTDAQISHVELKIILYYNIPSSTVATTKLHKKLSCLAKILH